MRERKKDRKTEKEICTERQIDREIYKRQRDREVVRETERYREK